MVRAGLRREIEVSRNEGGTELSDELLHRITLVAEALTAEVAVEAGGTQGLVGELVKKRAVVALWVTETRERRHEHTILSDLEWLARFRTDMVHVEGANLVSYDEHRAIVTAIRDHDADRALEVMTQHQLRTHAIYQALTDRIEHRQGASTPQRRVHE